jgi:uncharacterized protein involved in exopolysaccharide biosynthesis
MKEFDLHVLLDRALRGWPTLLVMALLFSLAALVSLAGARPVYRVEMTVVPAPSDQSAGATGSSTLTTLLGLAGPMQSSSNYTRYQKLLVSPVVASRMAARQGFMQEVFQNEWNAKTGRWEQPPTLRAYLLGWLFSLSSVPIWSPPDVTQLSKYLDGSLVILPGTTTDIVNISMNDRDPAFATRVMLMAHHEANIVLRDQVARRARQQVAYLQSKLAETTVADYRATLLGLLSAEEKTLMLTQTDADFAAEILSPPVVSPTPVAPRPVLTLAIAILTGILVGLALVIFFGPDWWRTLHRRTARGAWVGHNAEGGEEAQTTSPR